MTDQPRHTSGRRRPRQTEEQIRERMLSSGLRLLAEEGGLTVGLSHLSYEEVIYRADVPRSAGYRVWQTKEDYFDDLLVKVAEQSWMGTAAFGPNVIQEGLEILYKLRDTLDTAEGRRAAWIETARVTSEANFLAMSSRSQWRTYVAINATISSMPEESELRQRVVAALRRSEQRFIDTVGGQYAELGRIVGQRVRPETGKDFAFLGTLAASILEGMALRQVMSPSVAESFRCDALGEGLEWMPAALVHVAAFDALIEADPEFDEASVPAIRQQLEAAADSRPRPQEAAGNTSE